MSKIDNETGEVLEGEITNHSSPRSFANFLQTLEDGQLNNELSRDLQELSKDMNDHCLSFGSRAKGQISITIDFVLEKGVFDIMSAYKVKKPVAPRIRSIAWADRSHNLVPNNPKQTDMFKDVKVKNIKVI